MNDIFKKNNISKERNSNWDIYLPCGYNNIENELTVFNNKQLESKESDLAKRHNFKLDAESKIKSSDEEFKFTTELIPKLVNNIESILNKISAVQYRIKV